MAEPEIILAGRLEAGLESLLATVIAVDGEPPSRPGAKLLTDRDRPLAGTLGCSEFDSAAMADAAGVLASGTPATRTYGHDLGSITAYLEPYPTAPVLLAISATPVSAHLLRWAGELGFRTALLETRPGRALGAAAGVTLETPEALDHLAASELYAVATDHDAPGLAPILERVLRLSPRYVGVMGSRRHTGHHLEALRASGLPEEAVAAIQSPAGLDIGSRSAAEIALSILAGVIAARRGRPGGRL